MKSPSPCAVPAKALTFLKGADYSDAFEVELDGQMNALEAARKLMSHTPRWVSPLIGLRNILMRPFGLVSSTNTVAGPAGKVGFFPVLDVTDNCVVMGLNDKHLDFRLVVTVWPQGMNHTHVVVSNVLKRYNLLGRIYLAAVLPFHRIIVPAFMRSGIAG